MPTLRFGVLYCFFVITHDRRRILHLNATQQPTSAWTSQQLREAFPYDSAPNYLIFDRASNFQGDVINTIKSFGIQAKRTSFRSPLLIPVMWALDSSDVGRASERSDAGWFLQ